MNICIYIYIYNGILRHFRESPICLDPVRKLSRIHSGSVEFGYSAEGGAVGGGVQWMGVVLCSKLVYNTI